MIFSFALFLALVPFLSLNTARTHGPSEAPVLVIFDTDMDSDVDDVGALAMLHTYERAGKARRFRTGSTAPYTLKIDS